MFSSELSSVTNVLFIIFGLYFAVMQEAHANYYVKQIIYLYIAR